MWLTKDEREALVFYYKEWDNKKGPSSFMCKKPMNEVMDRRLRDQGLINTDISYTENDVRVSLTHEGRRLGKIYSQSWLVWSSLWFAEYKDHWFWLILSFLGGIIGALLINWFRRSNSDSDEPVRGPILAGITTRFLWLGGDCGCVNRNIGNISC